MTAMVRPVVALALVALLGSCGSSGSKAERVGFGPGLKVIGKDIAPGLYRSEGTPDCEWTRLRGLEEEEPKNVIFEDEVTGPAIAKILKSDKAFNSKLCGNWKPIADKPINDVRIHDGLHAVGSDIAPGDYHAPGGKGCHWERLSGTTGQQPEVIANDDPKGESFVIVQQGDQAFRTIHCGDWRQIE